jgi:hypothetical protein
MEEDMEGTEPIEQPTRLVTLQRYGLLIFLITSFGILVASILVTAFE